MSISREAINNFRHSDRVSAEIVVKKEWLICLTHCPTLNLQCPHTTIKYGRGIIKLNNTLNFLPPVSHSLLISVLIAKKKPRPIIAASMEYMNCVVP